MDFARSALASAPRELKLRSAEFRRARELGWQRLESMVSLVERGGISALSASEAREIATLYRSAVSSLSVARNIALDRNLLLYLENLTLRAYLVVYGPRTGMLDNMAEFFARGWPRAVRGLRRHLLVVLVIFAAAAAAGYIMVKDDINNFSLFMPENAAQGRGPESTREELLKDELFPEWPGFIKMFVA
ncbi:MAG: hypothetical protein LBU26_07075, partial [Synergistaceae bacterium]|nr:hypothetical protein [Synergistaceae bacterium]